MRYAPCASCGTKFSTPLDANRLCGYCAPAYRQALRDAVAAVKALTGATVYGTRTEAAVWRGDAVAAITALGGER